MDQTVALTPDNTADAEPTTVWARDLQPGHIAFMGNAWGLVRHVEPSVDGASVGVVMAGGAIFYYEADTLIRIVHGDRYKAELARLRDGWKRSRTLQALRRLVDAVDVAGLPLPTGALTISGTYRSADQVATAAEILGEAVREQEMGPEVVLAFDVVGDEYDPAVYIRFNHYARVDEPAVEVPDVAAAVRMAVSVDEVRLAEQADAEANCDGCEDVRLARGWRDDTTGLTSGPILDGPPRPHTCGREV